jgi:hypothetical protein
MTKLVYIDIPSKNKCYLSAKVFTLVVVRSGDTASVVVPASK